VELTAICTDWLELALTFTVGGMAPAPLQLSEMVYGPANDTPQRGIDGLVDFEQTDLHGRGVADELIGHRD
jgi:hypothetical protein